MEYGPSRVRRREIWGNENLRKGNTPPPSQRGEGIREPGQSSPLRLGEGTPWQEWENSIRDEIGLGNSKGN